MTSSSALSGIKVLDFGQYIAGPMAAMLLGDFGADVVRVDPPGGPRYNTAAYATWNRNKRSIVLDLKNKEDLETARRLVMWADVLVENFRPGVMARLGLGGDATRQINPRLIYCSLPGFRSDDPRAAMRAWEGILGAASGCFSTNPMLKLERPVYNCLPFSSVFGAHWAAVAISAALLARQHSGKGQVIEAPLFNATFTAFSGKVMHVHGKPDMPGLSTWRPAMCKDGRWFLYVPRTLHEVLLKQYARSPVGLDDAGVLGAVDQIFLTRTSQEWDDWCTAEGIEGTACYTSLEWMQHPLARKSGVVAEFDDPELGRFTGLGQHTRLSVTPGAVRSARPRLDEHRKEILKEISTPRFPADIASNDPHSSALQGIKVLDLGIILAIPSCGRTLAEFGADVIKIDSPHRNPVSWHNDINRAKRSLLLDLKAEEGREIFWKLLESADVVLENFRTGVADRLGIGYEAVRRRRPDIVYCSVNALGHVDGYARKPGREVLVQALCGMQTRYGGARPAQNPFNANDYLTGLSASLGVMLALLHRQRTGQGQYVNGALIYGATMMQTSLLQDYEGKDWTEIGGLDCIGRSPLYRNFQTKSGWLFIAIEIDEMRKCTALADLASIPEAKLEHALEARFLERPAEEWEKLLADAGLSAHRVVLDLKQLLKDPRAIKQGLILERDYVGQGRVTTTGLTVRMSQSNLTAGRPASLPGADAREILQEVGLAGELSRLIEMGVIKTEGVMPGGGS